MTVTPYASPRRNAVSSKLRAASSGMRSKPPTPGGSHWPKSIRTRLECDKSRLPKTNEISTGRSGDMPRLLQSVAYSPRPNPNARGPRPADFGHPVENS